MNKKAQIEVMGLMVIVLILVFVILIALKFFLVPKTNTEEIQRQSIQASNMLNAIIRSNTDDGSKVTNKIVECHNSADKESERCNFMDICPSTSSSCPSPNLEKDILRKAFLKKKYKLEFKVTGSTGLKTFYGVDCLPEEASITGSATVSVSPQITAKITLCVLPQQSI